MPEYTVGQWKTAVRARQRERMAECQAKADEAKASAVRQRIAARKACADAAFMPEAKSMMGAVQQARARCAAMDSAGAAVKMLGKVSRAEMLDDDPGDFETWAKAQLAVRAAFERVVYLERQLKTIGAEGKAHLARLLRAARKELGALTCGMVEPSRAMAYKALTDGAWHNYREWWTRTAENTEKER